VIIKMPADASPDAALTADAFFARARSKLGLDPPDRETGDFHLNPGFRLPPGKALRDAAVLIPVVPREAGAAVVLTQRTAHLPAHAGQIAFPGGKIDAEDAGPVAAALREAEEEIGLERRHVEPIGCLDAYLTGTGFRIVPVLARVSPAHSIAANPGEVEAVFEVPLAFLMTPANFREATRVFGGVTRRFYEIPFEGRYIWGATAGIIRALYQRVVA
jgi:8-oxo-dGTP pyrophosphatase MutT (NUDIX family)